MTDTQSNDPSEHTFGSQGSPRRHPRTSPQQIWPNAAWAALYLGNTRVSTRSSLLLAVAGGCYQRNHRGAEPDVWPRGRRKWRLMLSWRQRWLTSARAFSPPKDRLTQRCARSPLAALPFRVTALEFHRGNLPRDLLCFLLVGDSAPPRSDSAGLFLG
jgi:hypothetical protein